MSFNIFNAKSINLSINRLNLMSGKSIDLVGINRPTKRGREKSPSDGHCKYEKEIEDHLLSCHQILEIEPRSDTPSPC
jgi:hypothetical protein